MSTPAKAIETFLIGETEGHKLYSQVAIGRTSTIENVRMTKRQTDRMTDHFAVGPIHRFEFGYG